MSSIKTPKCHGEEASRLEPPLGVSWNSRHCTIVSIPLCSIVSPFLTFFSFLFLVYCDILCAQAFVVLLSSIVPNAIAGNSASSSLFAFQFLFSGFFLARQG